jgi:hypothetical protein
LVSGRRVVAAVVRQHQKRHVSEVQRFLVLHGKVDPNGAPRWKSSWIDQQRHSVARRAHAQELFQIEQFPEATITTQIDLRPINDLAPVRSWNCACR